MSNTNTKKARLDELYAAIRAASLDIERCVTSSYRTAKYTYSGFCFLDDAGLIGFYRNDSRLHAVPTGNGAPLITSVEKNARGALSFPKLPAAVRDILETMANARDRLEKLHTEANALESEIEAEEENEELPPPATISICGAEVATELPKTEEDRALSEATAVLNDRQTHARPRAFVSRFTGYDAGDIGCHRFGATAEITFYFEGEEILSGYRLDVPVIVTAPEHPYQSHNIEDDSTYNTIRERLRSFDSRWGDVLLTDIGEAIRDALKYEELPELEARRYCFGVNRDLETFATLRELGESEWERLQELDADEWREEPDDEPIEEPNAAEIDLLAMARDFVDDNRRLCDVSFDDFQDYLTEKIDAYFLEFQVAVTCRHDENPCVKAVVTCGGPYCDIRSFFGDYPEVYYCSGSRSRANIELSPVAREFFDTLVDWRIY